MHSSPVATTSNPEIAGTPAGIILTAVVATLGLAVLLGMVFLADGLPPALDLMLRRPGKASRSGQAGDISAGQGDRPWDRVEDRHVPRAGHPHGKAASWVLVAIVIAAFAGGGAAIITHIWWLLWACTATVMLAIPAGKVIGIMDDTVAWGSTPAATASPSPSHQADHNQDQPVPPGSAEAGHTPSGPVRQPPPGIK